MTEYAPPPPEDPANHTTDAHYRALAEHQPGVPRSGTYRMLEPAFKYNRAFCTEQEIGVAEQMRDFVNAELMPRRHDLEGGWQRDGALARRTLHELYAKLVARGLTRTNLPEKFGGLAYAPVVRQMVNEELSRADIGLATMVGKIHWVVSVMVAAGRDDLLEELAPRIVGAESWTACVAITEPAGGANVEDPALGFRSLKVTATREADEYVIEGHKRWPGPSGPADYFRDDILAGHLGYWTVATTDPALGPEGAGIFYVPGDAAGLEFSEPYQKMGFSWSDANANLYYNRVRIPARYRVDTEPGQGANLVKGFIMGFGRLAGAARLVGLSQAALEIVLDWAADREIAGHPLRERSLFANTLGEMFRAIDIARQYYLATTWMSTQPAVYGPPWSQEMLAKFSAARSFAADAAELVTNRGMELMGSRGYSYGAHLEKYMRDYKIVQMWLGGAHRDRLDVAQGLYGPFRWAGQDAWETGIGWK